MTGRRTQDENEERILNVHRLLRERHAGIEPDSYFVGRVIARLPRNEAWSFEWAVRFILPASLALAMALMIAVIATGGFAGRTAPASAAPVSSTSQTASDPLEWLLEGRKELR